MTINATAPDRNTKTYVVDIGGVSLYFSYNTLIAFSAPGQRFRSEDRYSNTTARHMREFGCNNWDMLEEDDLQRAAEAALWCDLHERVMGSDSVTVTPTTLANSGGGYRS